MNAAEIQAQVFAFILILIPIVASLWKVFSLIHGIEKRLDDAIERVDRRVGELEHRSDMRSVQMEALNDRLALGLNGTKELVTHLRVRTKGDNDRLLEKLAQMERYLVKETSYQSRE